jgi:hypothetical protein
MMFAGDIRISSYAIIVDNCRIPTTSLLERIRAREMMELSASRWNPTPAAAQSSPTTSNMDESIKFTTKPAHVSPTNLGPKVPLRQVSPPVQKRDNTHQVLSSAPSATAAAALESPTFTTRKGSRPNIPVRSLSPGMQPRSLLGEEGNSSSSLMDPHDELPMSPMLPTRHHRHGHIHDENAQQRPRMPQRKSSLLKRHVDTKKEEITRLLNDDDDGDEDTNNMDASSVSIILSKPEERQSLTRRPSIPTRQSSFEILPATLPTRQSSFELRHRAATSPLSEKVVAQILHHYQPSSPLRSQFSASMPNSPRQDSDDQLMAAAYLEAKLYASLPNMHLSLGVATSQNDQQLLSLTEEKEVLSDKVRRTVALDTQQHARRSRHEAAKATVTAKEASEGSHRFLEQDNVMAPQPKQLAAAASSQTLPPLSTLSDSFKVSTSAPSQDWSARVPGISGPPPPSPPPTTLLPRKPVRQFSFNSASSASSDASSSCKARRFCRFRPGVATSSLPVRNSSFDYGVERGDTALGMLPSRQYSFPGVHSTFRKL